MIELIDFDRLDAGFTRYIKIEDDLSKFFIKGEFEEEVKEKDIVETAVFVLFQNTIFTIIQEGSIAHVWGAINGM